MSRHCDRVRLSPCGYHGGVKLSKSFFVSVTCGRILDLALALGVVDGCRRDPAPVTVAGKQYPVRGTVVSTDSGKGEVLLNHEAIPGFMGAMTMPYRLKDAGIISELHPGDRITATLNVQDADGPANMSLDHIVVIAQMRPDTLPKVQYHVPAPGDIVPDYPLLNQSGHQIKLSKFRGKVVLLTFIYTRCAMADFCPKMSRNFAEIDKALASEPELYEKTHLLSISFDPGYDTPQVLRSYGGAYTGKYTMENFKHWDFAAPTPSDLPKVEQFFDLGVTGEGANLMHSLATVIVGKDGKVVAYYPTNDWTTDELLKQIRAAV
jgi:protein SCO1